MFDYLTVRGSFTAVCRLDPDTGGWTYACRNDVSGGTLPVDIEVEYEIACPCYSGVFTIPEIEAMPEASWPWWYPIPFSACADTEIGRPDMWADEVVRANIEALWPHMVGYDGVCNEPGTFEFNGWCLPIGCGYCNRDEDCLSGQRCELEPEPGFNHCVAIAAD
jgi:hypothetical protein